MTLGHRAELAGAIVSVMLMIAVFPLRWNPAMSVLFFGSFVTFGVMLVERRNGGSVWTDKNEHN